jgi:hypothetical protein
VTTSFDTAEQVLDKYPEFAGISKRLATHPEVTVLHGINAWQIEEQFPPGMLFDAIVWNHPHLGVEDFRLHKFLMAHFFHSAASRLTLGGAVLVTLVQGQETRWEVVTQAGRPGTGLKLVTCEQFLDGDYPGFICKRNKNGESFKNAKSRKHVGTSMESYTYTFLRAASAAELPPVVLPAALTSSSGGDSGGGADGSATPSPAAGATKEKEFKCNQCSKSFQKLRGLQTHVRQVHELKKCVLLRVLGTPIFAVWGCCVERVRCC